MKMDYTLTPDNLIAGKKEIITIELIVPVGKKVKRGDIVDKTASIITNTGTVYGIVAESVDGTLAETKTAVFVEGEFNIESVNYGTATKSTVIELCKNQNIYLKNEGGK